MENKIIKVWFDNERVFIRTATGEEKSHPLSWFPKLAFVGVVSNKPHAWSAPCYTVSKLNFSH